jgi:mannosyl-glycoprotein endo-beta-N-acetylglucosaminidase/stage II sporulation protein P
MTKNMALALMGVSVVGLITYLERSAIISAYKKMTRPEYINTFKDAVIRSVKGTGLFPSVKMAQAILESSTSKGVPGGSTLTIKAKNHFGIKADKKWDGEKFAIKTREVINGQNVMVDALFRKYDTDLSSFVDHTLFLKNNSRYFKAGVFNAATPESEAAALQKAGYSTDPNYAKTLNALINKHNLKELDANM